ncbi:MAG: thiamine diphosphokinase [Oscillospiraceae bacterium]|nr:thiamine diphosphokinase [Oscillospiraceae bacterium]
MKKCFIFCAGECRGVIHTITPEDTLIAADGGMAFLQTLPLKPDVILGDFDSLGYIPEGAEVHPVEKNDTDSMLAIKKGLEMGCDTFYLYGALEGQRLDHTMANFQALQYLSQRGCRGYLVGHRQIATAITDSSITLPSHFTDYLSVFCMGSDATGVSIRGAQYELEDATLTSGFPLGVSNRFAQKEATISVKNGTLLLMWGQHNGTV